MSKVWLITGSSRGLGLVLAGAVLAGGRKLVATARNATQLSDDIARIEADKKWRDLRLSTDFDAGGGSKVYPWERA